jgi:uracil-DNA glycosylase
MQDIINLGVYITTAIKCGKTGYAVSPATMKNCVTLLEKEIALFPGVKAFILGGDVAIKMMNDIWKRQTGKRVIPAGSTYKIRGQAYYAGDKRVLPSYTPAGKNFLIEKSKRRMVAEDIREALRLIR